MQKSACHIILGEHYTSYREALKELEMDSLSSRREKLSLKFALKCEKDVKFSKWFKPLTSTQNTRQDKEKYCDVKASHTRFANSPLSYLTRLLNSHYNNNNTLNSCNVNYSDPDED